VHPMMDSALGALKIGAVIVAIGLAGYLAVANLGWETTLGFLGFQTTTLAAAPASQCSRAQEQSTEDFSVRCISDRQWLRTYINTCAKGDGSGLAVVDPDGELTSVGTCPRGQRAAARERVGTSIPRGYRVADFIDSLRAAQ
jgi:hypothetical protein